MPAAISSRRLRAVEREKEFITVILAEIALKINAQKTTAVLWKTAVVDRLVCYSETVIFLRSMFLVLGMVIRNVPRFRVALALSASAVAGSSMVL